MVTLITSFYNDKNNCRDTELLTCLINNIHNKYIDKIILLSEQDVYYPKHEKVSFVKTKDRPTFQDAFSFSEGLTIVCNADIYIDETNVRLIDLFLNNNELFALSRWDGHGDSAILYDHVDSQDVWCFRGSIKKGNYDIPIGFMGCDNRIAYELSAAGYDVKNVAQTIKTFHVHKSGVKSYEKGKSIVIPKPYKMLPLISVNKATNFVIKKNVDTTIKNLYDVEGQKKQMQELSKSNIKPKYKLGIIILTLESRRKEFKELYSELQKQIIENKLLDKIKIYPVLDNGYHPIGYKRNKGVIEADAEYVCHFDDDDIPSKTYIKDIYEATKSSPDVITFNAEVTYDGENPETMYFNIKNKRNESFANEIDGVFKRYRLRMPCHLNPIKRKVALQFPFNIIMKQGAKNRNERGDRGSDVDFSIELVNRKILKKAEHIDKILYYYKYKQNK